jgi:adenine-specific DNA methylase
MNKNDLREIMIKKLIEKMLTPKGKEMVADLLAGTAVGEVSESKHPKSFSLEDEEAISYLEYILFSGNPDAILYGLKIARKFESEHKYEEAAYVYEIIWEENSRRECLRKGMVYYEERGNFGIAAKLAESLGDLERAEAYNFLHKIQLKLVSNK